MTSHHSKAFLDRTSDSIKQELITRVIHWDGNWFDEYSMNRQRDLPPILQGVVNNSQHLSCSELKATPIPSSFNDSKEYLERFNALIILELWETLCSSSTQSSWSSYGTVHHDTSKSTLECIAHVSQSEILRENDVLHLSIKSPGSHEPILTTAVVIKAAEISSGRSHRAQKHHMNNGMVMEFDLLMKRSSSRNNLTASSELSIEVKKMGTINAAMKQIKAMSCLAQNNSSLFRIFMNPSNHSESFEKGDHVTVQTGSSLRLNASQFKAVESITAMTTSKTTDARVAILQGPPGTGKTEVIAQIIRRTARADESRPPSAVLVCAPSNLAVDNIANRLLELSVGDTSPMRLVRVGVDASIAPETKKISLTHLSNEKHQENLRKKSSIHSRKAERLKVALATCNRESKKEERKGNPSQRLLESFNEQRQKLEREIKEEEERHSKMFENQKWETKLQILEEADVVFTTLATAGSPLLERVFSSNKEPKSISCCIIDEASQCVEPDFALPLSLGDGVKKVILVGDPQQLPATVLSQGASDCRFDQSLFNRIYKSLMRSGLNECVQILDTQYRMREEICRWPSYYFYDNKLMTAPSTDRPSPFIPYKLINLMDGAETGNGTGKINKKEGDYVIKIIQFLTSTPSFQKSIGVVTFYKDQQRFIEAGVRKSCSQMSKFVEVNTVDAFQGKEKDIIILSTVRAGKSGIGFVSSLNRMCVALTRARETQLVVIHFPTFRRNRDWETFINDGKSRDATRSVLSTECSHAYFSKMLLR